MPWVVGTRGEYRDALPPHGKTGRSKTALLAMSSEIFADAPLRGTGDTACFGMRIKKEGCQPSRLDLALHSEIRTHKKASHFSLPRNGRQFTSRSGP